VGEHFFDAAIGKHLIFPEKKRIVAICHVILIVDFITKRDDPVSELAGCGLGLIPGRGRDFPSAKTPRTFLKQARPARDSIPGILPRP
jgi:hypothetical protein